MNSWKYFITFEDYSDNLPSGILPYDFQGYIDLYETKGLPIIAEWAKEMTVGDEMFLNFENKPVWLDDLYWPDLQKLLRYYMDDNGKREKWEAFWVWRFKIELKLYLPNGNVIIRLDNQYDRNGL